MNADLKLPSRGFTKQEREWLEELIAAIKTVNGVQGANCTISDSPLGQVIGATDCPPCP